MLNGLFLLNSAAAVAKDPYFPYVTLLLPGNGSNGAQNNTFLDSSTNNFTITRNGNTTQGSFSPYGSYWSNYFDGSTGYLTAASNAAFAFGTGDFTIECWVYVANTSSQMIFVDLRGASSSTTAPLIYMTSSGVVNYYTNGAVQITGTGISANAWNHLAVARSGTSTKLFVNGTQAGSTYTDSNNYVQSSVYVGRASDTAGSYVNGYISNVRVVKGTAVYTSTFTPPTAPLTAISGTSLLTCQSNRFRDASSNAFAITVNGDTKVSRFSPFSPASAYSTTANGGSAYFDGSGDYLTAPSNAAFAFGTGDFTVEMWAYFMDTGGIDKPMFDTGVTTSTGRLAIRQGNASSVANVVNAFVSGTIVSSPSFNFYQWTHVAVVRQSGTVKIYINGVGGTGVSASANLTENASIFGTFYDYAVYFYGYMSNVRVTKGTAVYTANFTPPTAPVTAISGTSLLLNATNAAIFDNAMINDLETVGNAQVSTVQSKFGGSSMYFNGTNSIVTTAKKVPCVSGTGDFTIEFWLYPSSIKLETLVSMLTTVSSVNPHTYMDASGYVHYYTAGAQRIAGSIQLSSGQWYHVAVARSSGTTKLFINGTQSGSSYADSNNYVSPAYVNIGQYMSSDGVFYTGEWLNGYIDDLRITNGVARYTANFTPPTSAFPVQ